MPRPSGSSSTTVLSAAAGIAGLAAVAVVGAAAGLAVAGLSVGAVAVLIAAIGRRPADTLASAHSAHWWKYVGAGAATLAVLVAVSVSTGEFSSAGVWYLVMTAGLAAVGTTAVGLVLGIAEIDRRRRRVG